MGEHFNYKEYRRTHLIDNTRHFVTAVVVEDKADGTKYNRRDVVAIYLVDIDNDDVIRADASDVVNEMYKATIYTPHYSTTDVYEYAMLKGLPIVTEKAPFDLEHKAGFHYSYYLNKVTNKIKYYKYDGTPMNEEEYYEYAIQEDKFAVAPSQVYGGINKCTRWGINNIKSIIACLQESAVGETCMEDRSIQYIRKMDYMYLHLEDFLYEIYCGIYGDLKEDTYNIGEVLYIKKKFIEDKLMYNGKILVKVATATIKKQTVMIVGDALTGNIEALSMEEATELRKQGKLVYMCGFSNSEVNTKGKPKRSWCGVPIKGDRYMTTDGIETREEFIKKQVERVGYFFDMITLIKQANTTFDAKVDEGTVIGVSRVPKISYKGVSRVPGISHKYDGAEINVECIQDKYVQDSDIDGLKRISYTPLYIGSNLYKETINSADILENMKGNEISRNGKILTRLKCSGTVVIRDIEKIATDAIDIMDSNTVIDFQCNVKEVSRQSDVAYVLRCHNTDTLNAFMSNGTPLTIEYDGNMDAHTFIRLSLIYLNRTVRERLLKTEFSRVMNKKKYKLCGIPDFDFKFKEGEQFSYEDTYKYVMQLISEVNVCRGLTDLLIEVWETTGTSLDEEAVQDVLRDYAKYVPSNRKEE